MIKTTISASFTNPLIATMFSIARETGLELYIVGGTVRDILLGLNWHADIDMIYIGDAEMFRKRIYEHVPFKSVAFTNKGFLTERLCFRNFTVDLQPVANGSLDYDVAKRDFTVNALVMEHKTGNEFFIYDHVNGLNDIQNKRLRCVSDTSFKDDPLRVLRLFRMALMCGFAYTKDELGAARDFVDCLSSVAHERIRYELEKIAEKLTSGTINDMNAIGLDRVVFGFSTNRFDEDYFNSPVLTLFHLFYRHGADNNLSDWGRYYTFSSRDIVLWKAMSDCVRFDSDGSETEFYQRFRKVPLDHLKLMLAYVLREKKDRQIQWLTKLIAAYKPIADGTVVSQKFSVTGKELGLIIEKLHCLQITESITDPAALYERLHDTLDFS